MNNDPQQQDDEPVLNRLPFNMLNQQDLNNSSQNINFNNENNNDDRQNNVAEVGFFDLITPNEVVDIGTYFIPSTIYVIAIIIGLATTQEPCSSSFIIIMKIMLGINIACISRSFYQLLMISIRKHNTDIAKNSLNISTYILYGLYYAGTISCYVIFANRPDICFKRK